MYLVAAARCDDWAAVRAESAGLWRRTRRFNLPVQLALAAAEKVAAEAAEAARALLVSLAPCNGGSPDLHKWAKAIADGAAAGDVQRVRMNPIHTLHAVDNLALSFLSLTLGNRTEGVGFGGGAGMAWEALDLVRERLSAGAASEAIVVAGDQDDGATGAGGLGIAALFSGSQRPFAGTRHAIRITGIDRARGAGTATAHASNGLAALIDMLGRSDAGDRRRHEVPSVHGDGIDRIIVTAEAI
jgi:hypothetical protein